MATPPWLEGQNAGHFPNSLAQSATAPPTGLTALERMLDTTPCGPKPDQLQTRAGEPQYCQPWATPSSQLPLEPPLYSTPSQWYTPGGSQDYSPYPGQNEINYNYQQSLPTNSRYVPPGTLSVGNSVNGSQVQEVPNQYYNPTQLSQPPSSSSAVSDQPWWFPQDSRSALPGSASSTQRYMSPFNVGSSGYYEPGYPPPPLQPQEQQQQRPTQPSQQQQLSQQQSQQQQQPGPPPSSASLYNQSIPQPSNFNNGAPSPQTSYPQPPQFEPFVGYPNPLIPPSAGQSGAYYDPPSYCDPSAYSRGSVKNEPMNAYSSSQNQMMSPFSQHQPPSQGYPSNSNSSVGQQQYPPPDPQTSQMLSSAHQAVGSQPGTQQSSQRASTAATDAKRTRRRSRKGKDASLPERPLPHPPQPVMGNQPPMSTMNMGSYTHPMGPPPTHALDPYMNPYANQGGYPLDERLPVAPPQMTNYTPDQYIPVDHHLSNKRPGSEMMAMSDSPSKRLADAYHTNGMMGNPHMMNGMYQSLRPPEPPQGEDNSRDYSKEDLAEKDDSTQESTNTLESAKTENDDDDKGVSATNGESSKELNNSSSNEKDDSKRSEASAEDDEDKKSKLPLRKNIKDIKDEASLDERTRNAQKEEQERIKRLQEQRMRALNSMKELRGSVPTPYQNEQQSEDQDHAEPPAVVKQEEPSPAAAIISDEEEDDEERTAAIKKDVIDISSGDEDDPRDKHVINVSDESDEDEEIDLSTNVHPIRDEHGRVLINVGHADDEEDIFIAPQLAHIIKPHQINGVRFLYENVIESASRFNTSNGFGCILAHSMGLGKTIQVITFTDLFLRHTTGKKVLIITPINTIQNWQAEFDKWLPREDQVYVSHINEGHVRPRSFPVFLLNEVYKTASARHRIVKEWHDKGGVMLMGYEMYRTLALKKVYKPKGRKKAATVQATEEVMRRDRELLEEVYEALVNPGPDLVVCDEGHRIKNCNATTSAALKDIKTKRRVVLTGYPLQNNLIEYWCMVDFVRPSYLGTKMEFTNMFERPIQNGQCVDSTPKDRQLMKFRAHVLHSLLTGFVQRRGHGVLKDALPHKEEHVFFIRMTPIQRALYTALVNEFVTNSESANPLKIFAVCCKIWNHPDILYNLVRDKKGLPPTAVMDLDIDDGAAEVGEAGLNGLGTRKRDDLGEGGDPDGDEDPTKKKRKRGKKKDAITPTNTEQLPKPINDDELNKISYEWAYELMADYKADDISNSYKMVLLMEVIDSSLRLGDKLLVFSQSLLTLDLVERFLQMRDLPPRPGLNYTDKWVKNRTYFRLDGGTSGQDREKLINDFNHNPCVALFLLSTRAGCLGINLIGANRIVVLDASWNPCHDAQAVCRVYRYGQQKPCYIYRFVCDNSLEKRIYDRQVNKQGMSDRVVDEMNPEAKLTWKDVSTLIQEDECDPPEEDFTDNHENFKDPIMKQVVLVASKAFTKLPFEHESLLLDQKDQKLTKYEKKLAKASYEQEKRAAQLGGRGTYGSGITTMNGRGAYGGHSSRFGMVRDAKTGQMVPASLAGMQSNVGTALIHSLIKQGMTVQKMRIPKSITIGLAKEPPIHLQAGCELFVMKTPRGVYLRLPCERVIAMRLPQTLDQLCMARPSPFRPAAEMKKPEVINLDDEDDELSSDFDDIKSKPKVITIESETISKNKGLYDMLTKDYKSTKQEEEDILGKMAANKNLQLQVVTEAKPERKARIKITQRKKIDKEMAKVQLLNGETASVYEGDSDSCRDRCEANSTEDEEAFDLGSLSGEITVSPVKMSNTRPNRSSRKDEQVDLDADEGAPSSNENSQGSGSDNSTEVKRNPLAIQNLEEMLGGTKSAPPPAATIQ